MGEGEKPQTWGAIAMRYEIELCQLGRWKVTNSLPSENEAKQYAQRVRKFGAKVRVIEVDHRGRMVVKERGVSGSR